MAITVNTTIEGGLAPTPVLAVHKSAWLDGLILFTPVIAAAFFSKIALPSMPHGFGLELMLLLLAMGLGLCTRRLQMAPRRLTLFLLMLSVIGLIQVLRGDAFSLTSVALMSALGLSFVPSLRAGRLDNSAALNFFCNLSALLALLGICQFVLQFVGGTELAFPLETWLPEAYLIQGYNNVAPLYYGSDIFKSNGIFLFEPSVFSQLCALGLIAELVGKNRVSRLALCASALLLSYSGTGLMILALTLPILVIAHRRYDLLWKGLVFLAVLAIFAEPLNLDVTLRRLNEFGSSGSSATARFVSWQQLFSERLWNSPVHALFGYGAGSYALASGAYNAAEMAHSKVIYEFGIVGGLFYLSFIFYCIFSSRAPLAMRLAIAVLYFMNGAYTPFSFCMATTLLMWPRQDDEAAGAAVGPVLVGPVSRSAAW